MTKHNLHKLSVLMVCLTLLLPALCLAAPKKKATTKSADRRISVPIKASISDGRQRIALVIGNSSYSSSPLKNPANDARAMAAALRRLGFEVDERVNLTYSKFNEAVDAFGERLKTGGVGLFYYAGHGMQVGGNNYLIPVDAKINTENEVRYRSIDAGLVLAKMETAKSDVNIAIMDACRDNPFSRSFRNSAKGLATMDAPSGTIISYATAPGKTAADGSGSNGLFTAELLKAMETPGLRIEDVFKQVRKSVREKSNNFQTPWEASSLEGNFHFIPPSGAEPPQQQVAMAPRPQAPPPRVQPTPAGDSLDDIIAAKEAAERSKKARAEKIKADVAKYRKIVASSPELKQTAWSALVRNYPEARSVPVGNVGKLMKELGMAGGDDPTTGMEFVSVPEGCGTIGSGQVCFDAFSIGKYEVTQGQWKKVMGSNPGHFSSCGDNCPVEQVSWNDIQQFISRLNQQIGASYRLPTEAEWEYACRAGGTEEYCGSNSIDSVAWYNGNSGLKTHPVGLKAANAWGIHDMSGNVWEWCQDWYGESYPTGSKNPTGASSGQYRVLRGGSWYDTPGYVRASNRYWNDPDDRNLGNGFRLVLLSQD